MVGWANGDKDAQSTCSAENVILSIPVYKNLCSIDQYTTFLEYRIRQIHATGRNFFRDIFD
jgi:hypothetical protein